MAKKFITVEEYLGRRLTAGSYYQWMARMMQIIGAIETDNQQFLALIAELQPKLTKLGLLINQPGAFADTPAVKAADDWRDRLFTIIFMHIYYCTFLPASSDLSAPAKKLYPKVKPYKKLQDHEMTQETTELAGLLRVLTAEENLQAVDTLGLTLAVQELVAQNTIIQTEMVKREQEDAARKQLKDGETTATLRQQIGSLYEVIVQMVNAFVVMGNQSAADAVPELNSAIDHYQQIEAQKDGKSSGGGGGGSSSGSGGGSSQGGSSEGGDNGGSGSEGGGSSEGGSGSGSEGGSEGGGSGEGGDLGGGTGTITPGGDGGGSGSGSEGGGDNGGGGDDDPYGGSDMN